MKEITRPLDFLGRKIDQNILVVLKSGKQISGTLVAFDIHMNLVLDNARIVDGQSIGLSFFRGDVIEYVA